MAKKRAKRKSPDEHGVQSVDEQLDELFEGSWDEVEARSFEEVSDGTYQTKLLGATINNAKNSGRLQCSWEWIIIEGEFKGRHIFAHEGLNTEDAIGYFKGSLARLGYEAPESKKKLKNTLEQLVEGPTYAVLRLSTRKRKVDGEVQEIQNKRIIKALDSDEVQDDLETSTGDSSVTTSEEEAWEKGNRVKVKLDGQFYEGEIKKIKEDTADIEFDDGDKLSIALDELEETDSAEPEPEPAEVEAGCELTSKKFEPVDRRTLKKLAKKHDFNPDDYDNNGDLLCEIGDYCGLSGEFKSPTVLIKAIKESAE